MRHALRYITNLFFLKKSCSSNLNVIKDFTSLIDEGILFHCTGPLYLIDCIVKLKFVNGLVVNEANILR